MCGKPPKMSKFPENMPLEITTDTARLDVAFIHRFLTQSYWAKGRSRETVETCIRHSLNFGVFLDGKPIGYARVVTDYAVFAYLMDLFIIEEHRGKGYSKMLLEAILQHEALQALPTWRLATSDAHGLYQKFGFGPLQAPQKMMERKHP